MADKKLSFDDMVDEGVKAVIRAFGKGEDLRGAMSYVVAATAQWATNNISEKEKGS